MERTAPGWADRQSAFVQRLGAATADDLATGTIVVLPSATFPVAELRKITGIEFYEQRMLFTTLFLRRAEARIVYLTSVPVDEAIVEYYLSFLPDPAGARRRLDLVSLDQPGPQSLSEKLVGRPDVHARVLDLVDGASAPYILPFNVTAAEGVLSDALGLPLYGPHPELFWLGSKSGSRHVARRAGVAVLPGAEDLRSLTEVERAIEDIRAARPDAEAVVVKLNDGFSGQGNAIVELGGPAVPLVERPTVFCAATECWPTYAPKLAAGGGIVEELARRSGIRSPSVQVRIAPSGRADVVSTHDQVMGGPEDHVYLGCRFPADPRYRQDIQEAGRKVAEVLAGDGVIGTFGIDFVVLPGPDGDLVTLSEINLRMGGTTHPYWMCRLVTDATFDEGRGELVVDGATRAYVATDNLKSERLVGASAAGVIDKVAGAGLAFDAARGTGVCLHLLGALPEFGKMGVTCIGQSLAEAEALSDEVDALLG